MTLLAPDEAKFVGFKNYAAFFSGMDPLFWLSLKNTLIYAFLNVTFTIVFALLVALLLNNNVKGKNVFRTIFFIPSLLPAVASAIMFRWVFDPSNGVVNSLLRMIGVSSPPIWLESAQTALLTLVIISAYGFGGKMIIFMTGLNSISDSYYEAAEIDGAGYWTKLFKITLPLLSPIIFYNVLMGTIGALQVFTEGFVISGAGPGNSTLFYVLRLYNMAYRQPFRLGQASAMAWLLFIIIGFITFIYFLFSKKYVFYQDGGE
ncbi:carbohydrate ABC transporter permease [Peloplasma aerotolerans]|uniref:Sugar ABC transporter permease n=1 Tax=Peloplasma aerotolerans TaxID=3044389 RepID=A0AAW6U4A8_9MOLU|nr:sugar ABC transporter permease [Mariniplasma sp. M4Ah]MDI6452813.1 sugar ABC transporter permease [Mariniplasma sp. M4Ah]